jgi:hypothetical protein
MAQVLFKPGWHCFSGTSVLYHSGLGIAIPVHARTGPEGARRLRLLDYKTAHEGGKVVSLMHRLPLPPRKYSWYPFLLEAESTPGPSCGQIMLMKNSTDTIRNWTCSLPACSAVPHPTAPLHAPPFWNGLLKIFNFQSNIIAGLVWEKYGWFTCDSAACVF